MRFRLNQRSKWLVVALALLLCIAAALWYAVNPILTGYTFNNFVNDLRGQGVIVEVVSEPPTDFRWFPVPPRDILVNSQTITVFEFQDSQQALKAALAVSPRGDQIAPLPGTQGKFLEWIAPPHWYRKGQLIVLYQADDASVKRALQNLLGQQFAGG